MLQRVAVCCSVLQCVALCCSVLLCVAVLQSKTNPVLGILVWQYFEWIIAACCSVLQRAAVGGSVLQRVAVPFGMTLALIGKQDVFTNKRVLHSDIRGIYMTG